MTLALDEAEWPALRPGHALPPGERPPATYWRTGWVGPKFVLDTEVRGKKSLVSAADPTSMSGRPVRSQTLDNI